MIHQSWEFGKAIRPLFAVPFTNTHRPWINRSIKHLTQRKQKAYNFAKSNPSTESWAEYRRIKKTQQKICRQTYNTYINKLVDLKVSKSTKALWTFFLKIGRTIVVFLFYSKMTSILEVLYSNLYNTIQGLKILKPPIWARKANNDRSTSLGKWLTKESKKWLQFTCSNSWKKLSNPKGGAKEKCPSWWKSMVKC